MYKTYYISNKRPLLEISPGFCPSLGIRLGWYRLSVLTFIVITVLRQAKFIPAKNICKKPTSIRYAVIRIRSVELFPNAQAQSATTIFLSHSGFISEVRLGNYGSPPSKNYLYNFGLNA